MKTTNKSSILRYIVAVGFDVEVEVDVSKFDEKFMQEFRERFYPFTTIEEHIEHIAQLAVRGLITGNFIEGYGVPSSMGIKINIMEVNTEVWDNGF